MRTPTHGSSAAGSKGFAIASTSPARDEVVKASVKPPQPPTQSNPPARIDQPSVCAPPRPTTAQRNAISERIGQEAVYLGANPSDGQIRNGVAKAASLLMQKNGDLGAFLRSVAALAPGCTFGSDMLKAANAAAWAGPAGLSPAAKAYSIGLIVGELTADKPAMPAGLTQSELKAAISFGNRFLKEVATGSVRTENKTVADAVVAALDNGSGQHKALLHFFRSLPVRPAGSEPVDAHGALGLPGVTVNGEKFLVYGLARGLAGLPTDEPPVRLDDAQRQAVEKCSSSFLKGLGERTVALGQTGLLRAVIQEFSAAPDADLGVRDFLQTVLQRSSP